MSAARSTPGPRATRRCSTRARWRPTSASALELIADLVRAPTLDEAELEREKLVILSELGECLDAPDDLIHDHLFEAAYRRPAARAPGARARADASTRSPAPTAPTGWPSNIAPSGWSSPRRARSIPATSCNLAEALFGDLEPRRAAADRARRTFDGGIRADKRAVRADPSRLRLPRPRLRPTPPRRRCRCSRRRSAAACRRGCSRNCARIAGWLIRSTPGRRALPKPGCSGSTCRPTRRAPPRRWRWPATASSAPPTISARPS